MGTAVFTTLFLAPALASAGPTAGQVMLALRRRHLMTALPLAARTRRNVLASAVTIALLLAGSAGMAVARYLA